MMDFSARTLLVAAVLACSGAVMKAQEMPIVMGPPPTTADAKLPQYDVASVKPNKAGDGMMRIMSPPDGFSCTNLPLKTLIANAYGIRQDLISGGAGWIDSMGFDVDAKVSGEDMDAFKKLTGRERNSLLQALLADRFQLKVHHETKILPMYDLVVAKGGIKMKAEAAVAPSAGGAKGPEAAKPHGMMMMGPGELKVDGISIATIANNLAYAVHYTVTDKTGLSGDFDFDLKWTPDDAGPAGGDSSDESHVSIFTAVQEQLGLKLQPTKGPVDTLVIDHAEQPSEN
jgi:uncharacterized protein (TIGR03435 family)